MVVFQRNVVETARLRLREVDPLEARQLAAGHLPVGQRAAAGYPLAGTVIAAAMLRLDFESGDYHPGFGMYQIWEPESYDDSSPVAAVVVGDIGFHGAPDDQGAVEVGYGIVPNRRGRGLMSEALRALVAWAMRDPRVQSVVANTEVENRASQWVLRAAGFAETEPGGPQRRFVYQRPG